METSNAAPVLAALRHAYASPDAREAAIKASLVGSGNASPEFASAGAGMAHHLGTGLISDWNCFSAGCFFEIADGSKDVASIANLAVDARETSASGFVMAITPDNPPHKLIVLLNYNQNTTGG